MQGVLVPAGTPKPIVDRLNREIRQAMAQPDVQEKLAALGYEPVTTTPEEFAARIAADIPKWSKVIRDADIKLEQ